MISLDGQLRSRPVAGSDENRAALFGAGGKPPGQYRWGGCRWRDHDDINAVEQRGDDLRPVRAGLRDQG